MRKFIILLSVIMTLIGCSSAENPEPIEALFTEKDLSDFTYNGINANRYSNLFTDNFTNNAAQWFVGNDSDGRFAVENGYYYAQSKYNNYYTSFSSVFSSWDTDKNFEIEFSAKITQGSSFCGFNWGYKYDPNVLTGTESYYFFHFDRNGKVKIGSSKEDKESVYDLFPLSESKLNISQYNKCTIRKINKKYYFFLNEQLVCIRFFENFFDKRIAFMAGANSICLFDYIKIRYID